MRSLPRAVKFFIALLAVPAGVMLVPQTAFAQDDILPPPPPTTNRSSGTGSIVGRVVQPSGQPVSERCKVTLTSLVESERLVFTDNNGGFGFPNLPEATYTLEVSGDPKLYETVTHEVRLQRGTQARILINLKERARPLMTSTGPVVSAGELDSNVPGAARKEYDRGTALAREGKTTEAIERFQRAISLYPGYLFAHNDLGVQYLKLKRNEEAIQAFEAAIDINPKAFNPRLNMGIALVNKKMYSDAIDQLTQASLINSASAAPHLYLGMAHVETQDLEAAERELSLTESMGGPEFSLVHFFRAQIALKRGLRNQAMAELTAYLEKAPTGDYAEKARTMLGNLRQQQ